MPSLKLGRAAKKEEENAVYLNLYVGQGGWGDFQKERPKEAVSVPGLSLAHYCIRATTLQLR